MIVAVTIIDVVFDIRTRVQLEYKFEVLVLVLVASVLVLVLVLVPVLEATVLETSLVTIRTFAYFRRIGVVIRNRFGGGRDPIWLDTVNCTGNERSLDDCGHNPWGQNDCSHHEDVAISCNQTLSDIRNRRSSF